MKKLFYSLGFILVVFTSACSETKEPVNNGLTGLDTVIESEKTECQSNSTWSDFSCKFSKQAEAEQIIYSDILSN